MTSDESFSRNILRLIVWYPVRWVVSIVPVKCAFAILRWMGDIHYLLSKGKRAELLRNLKIVFRDEELAKTGFFPATLRQYFRNHYVNRLQILILHRLHEKNIEKIHKFEGIENLDNALCLNKGCILLHPHFGPIFLPTQALGLMGYPVAALLLTTDEGLSFIGRYVAFRLRVKFEKKLKTKLIPVQSFLRPVFEHLHNNGVLFTIGDGADRGKLIGKYSGHAFLGKRLLFPQGPVLMAKKTGSVILPIFTVLEQDGSYKTVIHKPINITHDASDDEIIDRFVELMQLYVKRYPYLWHFWDEFDERIVADA